MFKLIILFFVSLHNGLVRSEQYFSNQVDCNRVPIQTEPIYITPQFQQPIQQPIYFEPAVEPTQQQFPYPVQPISPFYPNGNNVIYVVPIPSTPENKHENHKKTIDWNEDKPNKCPPERKRPCFKNSPYRGCETDFDCDGVQKCCFDYCLEQLVCKPPVRE